MRCPASPSVLPMRPGTLVLSHGRAVSLGMAALMVGVIAKRQSRHRRQQLVHDWTRRSARPVVVSTTTRTQ